MSPCLHAEMMFCFLAQEDDDSIVYLTVIDILLHHKQLKKNLPGTQNEKRNGKINAGCPFVNSIFFKRLPP